MKNLKSILALLPLGVLFLPSPSFTLTVDEILNLSEKNDSVKSSKASMTQIVISADKKERRSTMVSYSINSGDKSLIEYKTPKRIKGMKILMLNDGDDIWSFSKRTNRVRKIASHQKKSSVNGSDFSYEDLSTKDIREDFKAELKGEEKIEKTLCYKIEFSAKSKKESYSKIISWISKADYLVQKSKFFDEDGELWKELTIKGWEKVGQNWSMKELEMKNIQKGSRTRMLTDNIEFDLQLKESLFSQKQLKR